ncbi:MAG: outer membrane protein assembly factor BamD [Lentimonas sp.]|jgi:outer membrane protein assembly factor BamD
MAITMNRLFCFFFISGLLAAASLNAAIRFNPLEWIDSRKNADTIHISNSKKGGSDETIIAAKFTKAEKKYAQGKTRAAKRISKKIIRRYPDSPFTAKALALRAQIHKDNGKWIKCFNDLQRIVDEYPQHPDFNDVNNAQFDCATALMDGARGRILWILPGFKQYGTAVYQFEQILKNAPYSNLAPFDLMNIALLSKQTGETENAIDALDRLINYYPQSTLAPDAYYNLAQIYSDLVKGHEYDQGSTRKAISYYEDFLVLFPNSSYTGEVEANLKKMENLLAKSRLDLGDFYYYYRNNNTAALVFYNEAITIEPNSDSAEEARLRIEDIEAGVRPISKGSIIRTLLGVK